MFMFSVPDRFTVVIISQIFPRLTGNVNFPETENNLGWISLWPCVTCYQGSVLYSAVLRIRILSYKKT